MQIIHMALIIQIIPDLMLPISPLSDTAFFSLLLGFAEFFYLIELLATKSAYLPFNDGPTRRVIVIFQE